MPGYSLPTREDDPVHTVRTIGRLAQMILELRDEFVRAPRPDTLDQIERRLDELAVLHVQLRERREQQSAAESIDG
ncbi:MAG TPA: hypothetical protein VMU89_11015 [Thermomicrobiaceae bacterium]|nr:hypothetical protein [Thermomicrobiaceae bacterium]